jgi:hypothetical protein
MCGFTYLHVMQPVLTLFRFSFTEDPGELEAEAEVETVDGGDGTFTFPAM